MDTWLTDAVCVGSSTDLFYDPGYEAIAKATCRTCPVRQECLDTALERQEPDGVWGGLTTEERIRYVRRGTPNRTHVPLTHTTYTTRARSTGATCAAGRTASGWGVHCETHDRTASTVDRTAAEYAVSRPEEWCPGCGVQETSRVG